MSGAELGGGYEFSRATALANLASGYEQSINSGYASSSGTVQINDASLPRLTAVLGELRAGDPNAHGGFWVMSDNSRVEMTGQDCESMLADATQRRLEIDQIYFTVRDEIAASETIEEVSAVAFDFGGD